MSSFFRQIAVSLLCFAACAPLAAQNPLGQILPPTTTPAKSNGQADPLGRSTPSGTIFGFLEAAQEGDYGIAAQYLQMSPARRQSEAETIVPKLKLVLDKSFVGNLRNFDQPEGIPQEGVPPGRQKVGIVSAGDVEADVDLVRVSDPSAEKIWLISADTLAKIPELYDQVQARQVGSKLPRVLVKHQFAGMPLWQWLGLLVAIPVAAVAGSRTSLARRRNNLPSGMRSVSGPAPSAAALLLHSRVDRLHYRRELDFLARDSVVPAPRAQPRSFARKQRYGFAHVAG